MSFREDNPRRSQQSVAYVPRQRKFKEQTTRNKASAQPSRFHGAFTGGFSAGHFNTAGSKEGWRPSDNAWKEQRVEDFMDDVDANEWGGPTGLADSKDALKPTETLSLGRRLLQTLGYVPTDNDDSEHAYGDCEATNKLSAKRLEKIRLPPQTPLPPPKIDTFGIAYQPFQNAPEFRAHLLKRRLLAQQKARAAGRGSVYRTSDLYNNSALDAPDSGGRISQMSRDTTNPKSDDILAYETAEDFVGTKTVGGFALHDDDDDVYDKPATAFSGGDVGAFRQSDDASEYHKEIYESSDSDADQSSFVQGGSSQVPTAFGGRASKKPNDSGGVDAFANALSTWASENASTPESRLIAQKHQNGHDKTKSSLLQSLTSDGKRPLPVFISGCDTAVYDATTQRWPGPSIPPDFIVKRHSFSEQVDPMSKIKEMSALLKWEVEAKRRRRDNLSSFQHQQVLNFSKQKQSPVRDLDFSKRQHTSRQEGKPMAGPVFAELASAMKNRFSSSTSDSISVGLSPDALTTTLSGITRRADFNKQSEIPATTSGTSVLDSSVTKGTKKDLEIVRTVVSWVPSPLLLKRFSLKSASGATTGTLPTAAGKTTEASYFHKEILGRATIALTSAISTNDGTAIAGKCDRDAKDGFEKNEFTLLKPASELSEDGVRPPVELMKTIFESGSEDESNDEVTGDHNDGQENKIVGSNESGIKSEIIRTSDGEVQEFDHSPSSAVCSKMLNKSQTSPKYSSDTSSLAPSSDDVRHIRKSRKRKTASKLQKKTKKERQSTNGYYCSGSDSDDDKKKKDHDENDRRDKRRDESERKDGRKRRRKSHQSSTSRDRRHDRKRRKRSDRQHSLDRTDATQMIVGGVAK